MNKQVQKIEALNRMKMLKLYPQVIKEFETQGIVNKSEHGGILFWLNDEETDIVKQFEKEHDCLVYHVILNYTQFGKLLTLLYVSQYEEEWGYDRDDIKCGRALAYVKNLDDDICSEFGSVGIEPQWGGLRRTC